MKKTLIYLFAALYLFAAGNGSPYSILGLGDYIYNPNTKIYGLGGLGYSYTSFFSVNYLNPAANSKLQLPRLEASYLYNGFYLNENGNAFYSNSNINGIAIGVPLERDWGFTFVTGLMPITIIKNTYRDKDFTDDHKFEYENNGSLSKLFASFAYDISSHISVGVSFDYLIFDKNKISRVYNADYNLNNAEFKTNYHFNALNYTFGLNFTQLNRFLGIDDIKNITLSFVAIPKINKSSDTIVVLRTFRGEEIGSDYSQANEISKGKANIVSPFEFGVGFNTIFSEYLVGFDYRFIETSDVIHNKHTLKDYSKVSVYLEYSKSKPRSYWETMPLRLGLSYEQTPYVSENKQVKALTFSTGTTLLLTKESGLDIAVSYTKRGFGTKISENILSFNIGIGFSEVWFVREEK